MTDDDILRMAIECQLVTTGNREGIYSEALMRFARMAMQHEREECAEVAERIKMFYTENAFDAHKARCAGEIKTSILKRSNT